MMDIRKILNLKMTKLKYQIKPKTKKFKVLLTPHTLRLTPHALRIRIRQTSLMSNVEFRMQFQASLKLIGRSKCSQEELLHQDYEQNHLWKKHSNTE